MSAYDILTGNVIAGVVSQEVLNLITNHLIANKKVYVYDSFIQNSYYIDYKNLSGHKEDIIVFKDEFNIDDEE